MKKLTDENSREQFEAWVRNHYCFPAQFSRHDKSGDYENLTVRASWRAWQASRDALPILEQQEVKSILLTDFKCEDDDEFPVYTCHECRLVHMPEERRVSNVTGQTKCPRCECLQFTRRVVDFKEPEDTKASADIPEQPTNQNGEQ